MIFRLEIDWIDDFDNAINYLNVALNYAVTDSERSIVNANLGENYRLKGNPNRAKECFKIALDINPENRFAKNRLERLR